MKIKNKTLQFRIDSDQYYELQKKAAINKMSVSDYARKIIFSWYDQADKTIEDYKFLVDGYQILVEELKKKN